MQGLAVGELLTAGLPSLSGSRDVAAAEDLAPAGTLPRSAWQGDRPPLLRDYHDDLVAEPLLLPVPSRTIVIQAVELLMIN